MAANSQVRSYSGFSKGLVEVFDFYFKDQAEAELNLRLPFNMQTKIEKRKNKYGNYTLSIDGVEAKISFPKPSSGTPEYFEVTAKVAQDIFAKSTLVNLKVKDKVNIGMLSKNTDKWLLDSVPKGIVTLHSKDSACSEYVFSCTKEVFSYIQHRAFKVGKQYWEFNRDGEYIG